MDRSFLNGMDLTRGLWKVVFVIALLGAVFGGAIVLLCVWIF